MSDLHEHLAALDLTSVGEGRFTATSVDEGHGVVFGGQLLSQTVVAGAAMMPGKEVKSLHTVFARGASLAAPLEIDADVLHQGRSLGSVSVTIRQGDRICTRSTVLAHAPDPDLIRHGVPMPDVAGPASLAPRPDAGWWDLRIVDGVDISDPELVGPAELGVWSRFPGAPSDLTTSQALLAHASDGFLIGTAMRPHAGVGQAQAHQTVSTTVLSQTVTFHEPFDASDWLLLWHESDYAGRGRAFGRANVFSADGRHVASYQQESMVRAFPEGQAPAAHERAKY